MPSKPAQPAKAADDDEWNFTSALPVENVDLPREHRAIVNDTSLRTEFLANRNPATPAAIACFFHFTNNTAQPISELHFQLAVTKVCFAMISLIDGKNRRLTNT